MPKKQKLCAYLESVAGFKGNRVNIGKSVPECVVVLVFSIVCDSIEDAGTLLRGEEWGGEGGERGEGWGGEVGERRGGEGGEGRGIKVTINTDLTDAKI